MGFAWIRGVAGLTMAAGASAQIEPAPAESSQVTVEVVETAPAIEATLAAGEPFHLRLRYSAGQPVRIWARPAWKGNPLQETFSHASPIHLGAGETLGWFSVNGPGASVDEVRISAVGAQSGETVWSGSVPVALAIGERGPALHGEPAWATALRAADQAAMERDRRMAASQPAAPGETLLFVGVVVAGILTGVLGTLWPLWALWRWRGGWRLAPLAPVAALAFVMIRIVVDTRRDPTSHNLWPLEILMVAGPAVIFMLVLAVARFVVRRLEAGRATGTAS